MKSRKHITIILLAIMSITFTPVQRAEAIPIAEIIRQGIIKVIKAMDLMIQRLQTKTIWLQNAQRVLENKLSELKLDEIAQWTEKHRALYKQYYDELWKVKNVLATYQRIRQITDKQARIITESKRAWELVRHDGNFTESEVNYIFKVYNGILNESINNLDQLLLVINSFKTQMTDAQRLAIITQAGNAMEQNLIDLLEFNMNTYQLSLSRAKTQHEVERIKKLYGL